MSGFECEMCSTVHSSYAGMMRCEADCYDETVAARKGHVSPRGMRPMRDWSDD